jgi:hypothetical protein
VIEVVVSQDRKDATLYMPLIDKSFGLYHSEGKVLDLVIFFLLPRCPQEMTMQSYINSTEDTAVINVEDLKEAA